MGKKSPCMVTAALSIYFFFKKFYVCWLTLAAHLLKHVLLHIKKKEFLCSSPLSPHDAVMGKTGKQKKNVEEYVEENGRESSFFFVCLPPVKGLRNNTKYCSTGGIPSSLRRCASHRVSPRKKKRMCGCVLVRVGVSFSVYAPLLSAGTAHTFTSTQTHTSPARCRFPVQLLPLASSSVFFFLSCLFCFRCISFPLLLLFLFFFFVFYYCVAEEKASGRVCRRRCGAGEGYDRVAAAINPDELCYRNYLHPKRPNFTSRALSSSLLLDKKKETRRHEPNTQKCSLACRRVSARVSSYMVSREAPPVEVRCSSSVRLGVHWRLRTGRCYGVKAVSYEVQSARVLFDCVVVSVKKKGTMRRYYAVLLFMYVRVCACTVECFFFFLEFSFFT